MPRGPSVAGALALAVAVGGVAGAEAPAQKPPPGGALFDVGDLGHSKEPITVVSDMLDYDYKANVVVYRGDVHATQGNVKLRSDTLTVTFQSRGGAPGDPPDASKQRAPDPPAKDSPRVREVVAQGKVRIDQGARWATGGKATFDQTSRTLVLTETPVLHDGPNEVVGDRVVVFLDENRSVVEGGRKRVKAVLYPNKENGLAPNTSKENGAAPTKDPQAAAPAAGPPGAATDDAGRTAPPPAELARP